ncbi:aminopeptidase [Aggregatilinea lenta]|uniref:aminopeptidase n=1 Tax=Aggregatilinea lenta TaxID=913108 RepID=UPI000E5AFD92|nr:aminopeptidase [Aggregatilinea lenta]
MTDPRWMQLADILVNYSTRTQPGERVFITMMETETLPLVTGVYSQAVRAGALPQVEFVSAYLERELMRHGTMEQIEWVPEIQAYGMEWADVYIGLRGARNPHEFEGIGADRLAAHRRALGKTSAMRIDQTRWVLIRVPNESFAQAAGTSLDDMMEFFFSATLRDWAEEARRYRELKDVFEAAQQVRIVGRETDITFSTRGRTYEVGDGTLNMPDGEIFTAPVDDSAEGQIFFEFPGVSSGKLIPGIRLEFKGGEVVRATADDNQDLLDRIVHMDDGARRLGEFGVGTNFGIDRYSYDILYDEKIGGTIHLALGRAYHECGGINQSALHWDIVKDLRGEGAIYLDGRMVLENGVFLV